MNELIPGQSTDQLTDQSTADQSTADQSTPSTDRSMEIILRGHYLPETKGTRVKITEINDKKVLLMYSNSVKVIEIREAMPSPETLERLIETITIRSN